MKRPILLQIKELINPIEQALERIENIRERKMNNVDSIILEGLFVLGVASFENSMSDTLRIILREIPDKLDIKSEQISKEHLIDGNPLRHAIEIKVQNVSYKSLPDILKYFTKITGINENVVDEEELNSLTEIKATRNLLLHNNLIENSFYIETAGPNKRNAQGGGLQRRLVIDQDYLFESLVTMRTILQNFKTQLLEKYASYTRIKAIRSFFNYIFQTPIMNFDHEFEVDTQRDTIGAIKTRNSRRDGLSSSERFYFDIWIAHTHGNGFEFNHGHFFRIGDRDKFSYFIKNIDLIKT